MSSPRPDYSKISFVKTFVLPALLIFVVPLLALIFFWHAQATFDARLREQLLQEIRSDRRVTEEQRQAALDVISRVPLSEMMANDNFASQFDGDLRFYYSTFRWMIRLSIGSLVAGLAVVVFVGACVVFSLQSQAAQYWSLLAGWNVLRIYGALQTLALGLLLLALSFWITALWLNFYSVKLILVVGVLALIAAWVVIAAIFTTPKSEFSIEGKVLDRNDGSPLWDQLNALCQKVGATPPDQVVAGIDDNFFVTEEPVKVAGKQYHGKTLFVSLALLGQMNASEAQAVLAHEMAHFSGQDTTYSRKVGPLLSRFETYLIALRDGGITLPIYYFMLCFRALFELSLSKIRREREFRADRLAAENTSPQDVAAGLLRVVAYSRYRTTVESELFGHDQVLESADVSARIAQGFPAYAAAFVAGPDLGDLELSHPFDSHPPVVQRLAALGVTLEDAALLERLATPADGQWRQHIPDAELLEREQWSEFEQRFRDHHESSLPYRFLPETPEERAIVERAFPPVEFEGTEGTVRMDCESIHYTAWPESLRFADIASCEMTDSGVLKIQHKTGDRKPRLLEMKKFSTDRHTAVLEAFERYYGRYLTAVQIRAQRAASSQPEA